MPSPASVPLNGPPVSHRVRNLPSVESLPVIDVAPLVRGDAQVSDVADEIDAACRAFGFFYVTGHGVPEDLQQRLEELSGALFALPEAEKARIAMDQGGRAWRGLVPLRGRAHLWTS